MPEQNKEIPNRPNANLFTFHGGIEIEYKRNRSTGRYRYDGQEWKAKRKKRWYDFLVLENEYPYYSGFRNIDITFVVFLVISFVFALVAIGKLIGAL